MSLERDKMIKNISLSDLELVKEESKYPIRRYDANGNLVYFENRNGYWFKKSYDDNNNLIYREDSDGYCYKCESGKKIEFIDGNYYIDGEEAKLKEK